MTGEQNRMEKQTFDIRIIFWKNRLLPNDWLILEFELRKKHGHLKHNLRNECHH